jgi:hypothetical protein
MNAPDFDDKDLVIVGLVIIGSSRDVRDCKTRSSCWKRS